MGTQVAERKTQVYFSEELHRQLKEYARRNEISMAEVIRQAVWRYLQDEGLSTPDWENDPINKIVGMFKGTDVRDASENHDYYVYGFPLKSQFRKGRKDG
jgi:hypothetical protein